mmetsp:Transcript_17494/g.55071  ORF Transcript_17494/g.55071 Transcript_17494/m.55071 type:complete len:369 (+) Transcript_17494:96-1202(+)
MMGRPVLFLGCLSCITLTSAAPVGGGAPSSRLAPGGSCQAKPSARGSVLMQFSARTQDVPGVLYGVMTNGLPKYQAKLAAQLQTWAAGVSRSGRFFSVAGRGAGAVAGAGLIVEDRCPDDASGIACKEERLVEEGYTRGAQWLVILGEDNWVDTVRMEEALRNHSTGRRGAAPTALGIVGCGKGLSYCPEVTEFGGFCGGGGYAINRAALQALMKGGQDALRKEYADMAGVPGDIASSCALRQRGVQLMSMPSLEGNRIEKLTEFRNVLKMSPITLHYCTPDVMRWVQASVQGLPESEVQAREVAAFDGGCCCSWQPPDFTRCKQEVHSSPSQLQVQGSLPPLTWDDLRDTYIRERDGQLRGDRGPFL